MKKSSPIFVFLFAVSMFSFIGRSSDIRLLLPKYNSPQHMTVDTRLYALYYFNPATNPLKNFLNRLTDHSLKVVFQFCFLSTGELTLGIITGKKNNSAFNENNEIKLSTVALSTCTPPNSIDSKQVYLGDQEILNQTTNLAELIDLSNKSAGKYLVFVPSFDYSNPKKTTIKYDVYIVDDITNPQICGLTKSTHPFTGISSTNISTNPSPPRPGNQ
jgi:hypothetical protein